MTILPANFFIVLILIFILVFRLWFQIFLRLRNDTEGFGCIRFVAFAAVSNGGDAVAVYTVVYMPHLDFRHAEAISPCFRNGRTSRSA